MQPPQEARKGCWGPVLECFPEHEDSIKDLSRSDPAFRELCSDYAECVVALQRLRARGARAIGLVEDYTELRVGLEHELLAGIARRREASGNPPPARGGCVSQSKVGEQQISS